MNGKLNYEIIWERNYERGYANCRVKVDSKDNIAVCGIDKEYKGLVLKYDKNGNLLWSDHTLPEVYKKKIFDFAAISTTLNESFGGFLDVAIDKNDNIFVVGSFYEDEKHCHVFVRKYNSDGKEIWTTKFSPFQYNQATGIVVDKNGDVYIAGYGGNVKPPSLKGFIAKFSGLNGRILWHRKRWKLGKPFTGFTSLAIHEYIYAVGLAIGLKDYELLITKYGVNGLKRGEKTIDRKILAGKIIFDGENFVIAGQIENDKFKHYLLKITPSFGIVWEEEGKEGGLYDVAINNYIAVTGKILEGKYHAGLYSKEGEKLLDLYLGELISQGKDINDWMRGVDFDSEGNLIVVGGAPVAKTIKVRIKEAEEEEEEEKPPQEEEKKKSIIEIILEFLRKLFR